jgi:signal transduction histidine kinase
MAVAGHDLKQPIQVAMLCLERALDEGVTTEAARRLRFALDAMKRLDSELSDIARLSQASAFAPLRQVIRIADVLSRIEHDWRMHAQLRQIDLDICRSDLLVTTDPDMLHTILRNIVGNALKYSANGSQVRVVCEVRGDILDVSVEDDGCGIDPAIIDRIFDAFERGHQTTQSDGLGLGLLIVRQTADMLHHRVSVYSGTSGGSRFSVELPLHIPGIEGFGSIDDEVRG